MKYLLMILVVGLLAGTVFFTTKDVDKEDNAEQTENNVTEESLSIKDGSRHTLDLSNQGISQVPDSVFAQTTLEELNISHNSIGGSLQAEVRFLQNLKVLDLSNNNFTGVPAEVGQLSQLEILNLSNNPITGLPYDLGNLKKLQILDLRGTNYSKQDLDIIKQGLPTGVEIKVD